MFILENGQGFHLEKKSKNSLYSSEVAFGLIPDKVFDGNGMILICGMLTNYMRVNSYSGYAHSMSYE